MSCWTRWIRPPASRACGRLALTAPAIYGYGQAGDAATIRAGNLIWNGAVSAPAGVVNNGAGTGQGR